VREETVEALISVLVEAIGALVAPLVDASLTLVGGLFSTLISGVIELIGTMILLLRDGFSSGREKRREAKASPMLATQAVTATDASQPTPPKTTGKVGATARPSPQPPRQRRRWTRWLLIGCGSFSALVFATLLVINQWFLDDIARSLLEKQQARSGIAITAETIEGNLFSGRFQATGITVRRSDHPAGLIDLTVRKLDLTVAVWRVFADPVVVDAVTVDGVRGRYERGVPGQAPVKKPFTIAGVTLEQDGGTTSVAIDQSRKKKRPFVITALTVTDLDVAYADHTRKRPLAVPVTITRLTANPLRSQWAVLDVLFRANATGTIAGRPLTIITTGDDLGRDTQWTVDGLPIEVLADQIGGPFALLSAGTADVHVTDHWRNSDDERIIVMDWQVVLNHVTAEVPETTSKLMALMAKPAAAFINAKGDRVPLSFRVEIDEDRFDGATSAEAAGLWQVVGDSATATLAKMLGIKTDTVKDVGETALDAAKAALDQWRKKKKKE
jgi:hypothetical protein